MARCATYSAEVKQIFDPQGILNPGKIVGGEGQALDAAICGRCGYLPEDTAPPPEGQAGATSPLVNVQLNWSLAEMAAVATRCNGCGSCRDAIVRNANVPDLSRRAGRRSLAAGQGEYDSRSAHRPARSGAVGGRRIQRRRRSVRELPSMPVGVPGRRRHSQADARRRRRPMWPATACGRATGFWRGSTS